MRTALTTEMWDAINGAWLELRNYAGKDLNRDEFGRFLDWVKTVSLTFDGSAFRTMLRNDAFWFTRLGTAIERADNTARILDVKYQILLPHDETVGGSLDYFQWTTILREVSAFNAYHWVYRESVKPLLVADLLMLNKQMPRSFANCYGVIVEYLDLIADAYGRRGPSQRLAGNMLAKLEGEDINRVFASGCTNSSKRSLPRTTGWARRSPSSIWSAERDGQDSACASAWFTRPSTPTSSRPAARAGPEADAPGS